jgi:hypothetical protein
MKYIITLSLALALSINAIAQTGLVFSQCLTFGAIGPWVQYSPPSDAYRSPQFTVPEGKIWKIEYAGHTNSASGSYFLEINNVKIQQLAPGYGTFPIWAKSGDVLNLWGTNTPNNSTLTYFFSILEFNNN